MYKDLRKHVVRISAEVGDFLRTEQAKITTAEIEFKSKSNDLVSRADKEAETRFVDFLQKLLPEAGFIAEEGTGEPSGGEYDWIIDPLDGTTNYLYGIPCYCTSVALKRGDDIVVGVIHDPTRNESFSASKGEGAFLNGVPIRVSAQDQLQHSLVAMGFPYDKRGKQPMYLDILGRINMETRGIRRLGAAAIDMAYVACGRVDAFYEYGLNPWDVAAGALIVSEAGGTVSDYRDGDDYLFGETILCDNTRLHDGMLDFFKDWE